MVPGITYISFLTSILNFLSLHPNEIVFVELKSSGFIITKDKYSKTNPAEISVYSMIPSAEDYALCLEEARKACETDGGRSIAIGGVGDLDREIGELIKEGKRLILTDKCHEGEKGWQKADSYGKIDSLFLLLSSKH